MNDKIVINGKSVTGRIGNEPNVITNFESFNHGADTKISSWKIEDDGIIVTRESRVPGYGTYISKTKKEFIPKELVMELLDKYGDKPDGK